MCSHVPDLWNANELPTFFTLFVTFFTLFVGSLDALFSRIWKQNQVPKFEPPDEIPIAMRIKVPILAFGKTNSGY
jgi:hypothetical protein